MSVNVWEWCADHYKADFWKENQTYTDPFSAPPKDDDKISMRAYHPAVRGGSWSINAANCRVSYRFGYEALYRDYNTGFRVVLPE